MRIGIVTQPLKANYGGVIQNWALQQVLKKMGHEPITIDYQYSENFCYWCKINFYRFVKSLYKPSIRFEYLHKNVKRPIIFDSFIKKHIDTTKIVHKYSETIISKYQLDCIIIGSDQVWRPKYNHECLFDMFGQFIKQNDFKIISYAASFGTDDWEYSDEQTIQCAKLIKRFGGISVREPGGVKFCKEKLKQSATQVLDPTLLLSKEEYNNLASGTPPLIDKPFLAAYILDPTEEIVNHVTEKASRMGLKPFIFNADKDASLTPIQWLTIFRDANYIITDSFHGSVFSIIYEKKFEPIENKFRGSARFNLINQLKENQNINELREQSLNWLLNKL